MLNNVLLETTMTSDSTPDEIYGFTLPSGLISHGCETSMENAKRFTEIWGIGTPVLVGVHPDWKQRALDAELRALEAESELADLKAALPDYCPACGCSYL